jgi:phage terminase small subunit
LSDSFKLMTNKISTTNAKMTKLTPKQTKLTPKQSKFCEEYLVDLNGTQACIRAGYSAKTAQEQAAQNLSKPIIQALIQELRQSQQERTQVKADSVVEKLANIVRFELNQIGDFDGQKFTFKPECEWTPEARTSVANIKQNSVTRSTKSGEIRTDTIEIKFESKLGAIEILAKHLGMFQPENKAPQMPDLLNIVVHQCEVDDPADFI